jgi:hypothetical protein
MARNPNGEDRPPSKNLLEQLMEIKCRASLKRAGIEEAIARHALRVEKGERDSLMHVYVRDLEASE